MCCAINSSRISRIIQRRKRLSGKKKPCSSSAKYIFFQVKETVSIFYIREIELHQIDLKSVKVCTCVLYGDITTIIYTTVTTSKTIRIK